VTRPWDLCGALLRHEIRSRLVDRTPTMPRVGRDAGNESAARVSWQNSGSSAARRLREHIPFGHAMVRAFDEVRAAVASLT